MIRSDKFPGDCLFFIFEQDFELYPDGNIPASKGTLGSSLLPICDSGASSSAGLPLPQGLKRKPTAAPEQPPAARSSAPDIVKMVNAAARKGVGDLVWLGYNPKSNRPGKWSAPRVKFGTQLVCLTRAAADNMQLVMGTSLWKAEHIDMWILKFCQDHRFSHGRCSYVFPPLGCFGAHASECCPETGFRKSWWDEDYTAVGTRPSEDTKGHRSKDLYGFTEGGKGHVDWKVSLKDDYFSGQDGVWRTFVNLVKQDDTETKVSQLVNRRRRREHTNLKWRTQTDTPAQVAR